jgi:hypothetical protein
MREPIPGGEEFETNSHRWTTEAPVARLEIWFNQGAREGTLT